MNWSDYVVLGVILCFAIIGLANGFIFSVFKVASFFLSIYVSIKFYPAAAGFLAKTPLYDAVKASIIKSLTAGGREASAASAGQASGAAAETVIGGLRIPDAFKKALLDKIPDPKRIVDVDGIISSVSGELARIVMGILGLILLYVAARIAIMLVGRILKGVARLPVLKQFDRLGGFALGVAEGVFTVYILCAVLVLFNTAPWFGQIFASLDNSLIAGYFYENNFIVNFMFPAGKA